MDSLSKEVAPSELILAEETPDNPDPVKKRKKFYELAGEANTESWSSVDMSFMIQNFVEAAAFAFFTHG